jgi:alpha-2-macroglobulin
MRIFKTLLAACGVFIGFSAMAQNLTTASQKSDFKYAFKLTDAETKIIETKGINAISEAFLHSPVDSMPINNRYFRSGQLAFGNYLVAHTEANLVHTEFLSIQPFQIQVLNNEADLKILLTDDSDKIIPDAIVFLGSKQIHFNPKLQVYQIEKRQRGGFLKIEYKGVYYTKIKAKYPSKAVLVKNRMLYGFPLGYIFKPIRDIKNSIKYKRPQGFVYNLKRFFEDIPSYFEDRKDRIEDKKDQRFENKNRFNFIVFNKPKYQPKDTVKACFLSCLILITEEFRIKKLLN